MKYRKLGNSEITVSAVAMGCWGIVGDSTWGPQEEKDSLDTIRAALEAGITLFDTAEMYGNGYSEELLGKALAGSRPKAVIASKTGPERFRKADLVAACEQSLERLDTDYIDLYQLHWSSRQVPLSETLEAAETLKQQGKIRAIGVCNFGKQDLQPLPSKTACSDQLAYNLLFRAIEYGIQSACAEKGLSILCYSPLAQGLLTGKFASADEVPAGRARTRHFSKNRAGTRHGQEGCEAETFPAVERIRSLCRRINEPMDRVSLAWLLHQPGVASVLAGARNPAQIQKNAAAGDLELSADVLRELTEITDELKRALGPNPDMWQGESRIR